MKTTKTTEVKMIGLDLDGTTLTSDKKLTPHTKEVLEACLRQGIVVLPATGRPQKGIPEFLKTIEGLRYVVTSNGASIVDLETNEVIYENGIPWERALELLEHCETYGTFCDAYLMGQGWCEGKYLDHLEQYKIEPKIEQVVRETRTRIDDLKAFIREKKRPVEKINMFFPTMEERNAVYEELCKIPDIAPTYALKNNLEINNGTCNKGEALISLGKILSIPKECIMGCGDGINDLAMIQQVGVGVAMENAYPLLKEHANFITKTNDEEGVAYAIEHFCDLELEK